MKALALVLALLYGNAVAQDMVAHHGKDHVRITDKPCPASILALTPEGTRGFFRAAFAIVGGKAYSACWALRTDGGIYLLYEDGDAGLLSQELFKLDEGI